MKVKQVHVLFELKIIPDWILREWVKTYVSRNPNVNQKPEELLTEKNLLYIIKSCSHFTRDVVYSATGLFVVMLLGSLLSLYAEKTPADTIVKCLPILFIVSWIFGLILGTMSISGRAIAKQFASDLSILANNLGGPRRLFGMTNITELKVVAEEVIERYAENLETAERDHGPITPQAEAARRLFKDIHTNMKRFSLVKSKWDRYFGKPERIEPAEALS